MQSNLVKESKNIKSFKEMSTNCNWQMQKPDEEDEAL